MAMKAKHLPADEAADLYLKVKSVLCSVNSVRQIRAAINYARLAHNRMPPHMPWRLLVRAQVDIMLARGGRLP